MQLTGNIEWICQRACSPSRHRAAGMAIVTATPSKKGSGIVENNACSHTSPFFIGNDRFIALQPSKSLHTSYRGPPCYATVIPLGSNDCIAETWLRQALESYRSTDDVFRDDFLAGVIFTAVTGGESVTISPAAKKLLESLGTCWVEMLDTDSKDDTPPPGPYVAAGQQLSEVFRLYDDVQGAFMNGFISTPHSGAEELHVGAGYAQALSIAVPSRLRDAIDIARPLAGLRVAVKDIFQIEGIRTSLCNRAYYELYPPATKTAGCIEMLSKAGARVVGTTRLASFAATEEPIECVDFQAPWNPRADGYQSPAGSSSGSGVAIASYAWLDVAIGSDMVLKPVEAAGGRLTGTAVIQCALLMEYSPSTAISQALSVHNAIPLGQISDSKAHRRQFDVPCFYGRDMEKCRAFANHWYGDNLPGIASLPPALIYPSDYMALITNRNQLAIVDSFVADLELSLGVEHRKVSFESLWNDSPPIEANGQGLEEYMKDACRDPFFHDDYHNFDQFREDYSKMYSKSPYVSPPVRRRWDLSAKITKAERDTAIARLEVYRKWFSQEVMQVEKRNSIVIIPIENISPRYRDEATSRSSPVGVPMLFLSPITGGPELTIPVGETPFQSRVTGRCEHLPVAVSLLASSGRDLELFDQARECLRKSGRATVVCAGNKLFSD